MKKVTFSETNSSPLKIGLPNRNVVFQPSICRGKLAVSFREGATGKQIYQQPGIPALLHCAALPESPSVAWRAASALANLAEWPELVATLQEAAFFFAAVVGA